MTQGADMLAAPDISGLPPHNIEVEQALLGAIFINNQAYGMVAGIIKAEDFYEPLHSRIFEECARQIIAGKVVTPVTLKSAFPEVDFGGLTTSQYLARLAAEATTVINAPDFAAHVRDLATIRAIIGVGRDLSTSRERLYAPDAALREAFERLDALRVTGREGDERASIGRLAERLVANADQVKDGTPIPVPSTGFTDLDRQLGGGYRAGRLIVLAGRPGMGKTVLEAASARRVARRGYGAAIFSLEIDGDEMSARIVADELAMMPYGTPGAAAYRDILTGELDDMQRHALAQAAARVQELPIEIDATGGLTFFEIAARTRITIERWRKREVPPGVIFIDYLGLVTPSDRYRGRKVDELGEIAKAAKDLAKRLQVCVVLLAQLNRVVESRDDKRPNMSDLRDSGNIEEHADVVGLLYRPYYYDQRDAKVRQGDPVALERMEKRKYDLDLGLGKNRLGPTATVRLWCDVGRSAVDNARLDYR